MARESCNLDKEEAEMIKPSSSPAHKEEASPSSSSPPTPPQSSSSPPPPPPLFKEFSAKRAEKRAAAAGQPKRPASVRLGNRCFSCLRKVGLTGFRCRCGDLFCGQHRYSDTHDCSFDYKALGREQISKANPVVRAAKIIKI